MGNKKKPRKYLKYFELTVEQAQDWNWKDYLLFLMESLYQTVFPFFAGAIMVHRRELVWFLMLIIPIYFKLRIDRGDNKKKSKKLYVKD